MLILTEYKRIQGSNENISLKFRMLCLSKVELTHIVCTPAAIITIVSTENKETIDVVVYSAII